MKPFLLCLLFLPFICSAQTVIPAQYNHSITADGTISLNEWNVSSSLTIAAPSNTITYMVAYDSLWLYVVCHGKLESANALFPEILLDVNNSKSNSWENDDWWLHVSATDCENQGAYSVYNNCAATQPDWIGIPNFSSGPPMTDTIEAAVKWSKLGFDPFSGNDLGISLLVTNTFSSWHGWPAGYNYNDPSTWGILDFPAVSTVGIEEPGKNKSIQLFPNPSNGEFSIRSETPVDLSLINGFGQLIAKFKLDQSNNYTYNVTEICKGIYFVTAASESGENMFTKKIIIN